MGGHDREQQKDFTKNPRKRRWSPACALCEQQATVYCPWDEAMLCDPCDAIVHSANFLVARHSRHVLCACCGQPALHSPHTGPRIEVHRVQEPCAQCTLYANACPHDVGALSGTESCCIDADEDRSSSASPSSTPPPPKRLTRTKPSSTCRKVLSQEEGLGDSEDGRYGLPFLQSPAQKAPSMRYTAPHVYFTRNAVWFR